MGTHQRSVVFHYKQPVMQKAFPCHDVFRRLHKTGFPQIIRFFKHLSRSKMSCYTDFWGRFYIYGKCYLTEFENLLIFSCVLQINLHMKSWIRNVHKLCPILLCCHYAWFFCCYEMLSWYNSSLNHVMACSLMVALSYQLYQYRKISNIRRTKSPNLNVSRLFLQLSLPNPMKPGVKSRMKM